MEEFPASIKLVTKREALRSTSTPFDRARVEVVIGMDRLPFFHVIFCTEMPYQIKV
jgi:hypothetical protein